jgi:hypothetical protein
MWVHDLISNLKAASIEWKQTTFPQKRISSTCSLKALVLEGVVDASAIHLAFFSFST